MTTMTSTHFVSSCASGETWRDVCKTILESLQQNKTEGFRPNVGFLYVTEALGAEIQSIITLFRSVTGIEQWTGCVAAAVCGPGIVYTDAPAVSVLIGAVPSDQVRALELAGPNARVDPDLEHWLNHHDPMLVYVHADPWDSPVRAIEEIEAGVGGFMVGGLASPAQGQRGVFSATAMVGASGFVFSQEIAVATALSQGCRRIGQAREISLADRHVIGYLDGRPPMEVFSEDMKAMIGSRLGYNPGAELIQEGYISADFLKVLKGQAHVGFPVAGSDQNDFLVRNIIAMDTETGSMAVGEEIEDGQKMFFVHRDDETVRADLSQTLISLRRRIVQERGEFNPKAALYVSCIARLGVDFAGRGEAGGEMGILREILGHIPVAGFYAQGEISGNRLYGYTGIVTLFL